MDGIQAENRGLGSTTIKTKGKVSGDNGYGICAANQNIVAKDLIISQEGGEISGSESGIYASNTGSGFTNIDIGGVVEGGQAAIVVTDAGSGVASISTTESGHIGEQVETNILSGGSAKLAIVTGGAFVEHFNPLEFGDFHTEINNAGTIVGTVQLGDQGNTFTNSGIWNTSAGTNEFGAGTNTLTNSGKIITAMRGANTPVTTTFNGLTTFTNNTGGVLSMSNGVAGDRTIISGDYIGNGGTIKLDAELGDDGSATDRLIIKGNTSGSSNVEVTNISDAGALTVEGIKIIEVGGTSAPGSFALQSDYVHNGEQAVVSGAYAYKLYQNGISTPDDGDWYLRSQLNETEPSEPSKPLYQAGAPIYEAYTQTLLNLNSVSTLQQRVGNRTWSNSANTIGYTTGVGTQGYGFWSRIEGSHSKFKPNLSTTSADYRQNTYKMQIGFDGLLKQTEDSHLVGGLGIHYVHGQSKINSVHGDGDIHTKGYGLTGTLTWYGDNGVYLDGQAQATWYDSDLSSRTASKGLSDGNDGFGYAFSLEGGKRIALNQNWSVTPQAQLVYSKVDFDSFTDAFGARVRLGNGDSLQGRLGATIDYELNNQSTNGRVNRSLVYGIANLKYEFLDGTSINIEDTSFKNRNDRLWAGVGVGLSHDWTKGKKTYTFYGEGIVDTSLNHFAKSNSLNATLGFRMQW